MMTALVSQLSGKLEFHDNDPGLRAVLYAPTMGNVAQSLSH